MGSGDVIDLTGDQVTSSHQAPLRMAMVTRYLPSVSGAARAASDLVRALIRRFGVVTEVIRLVDGNHRAAAGRPVVMELNPRWSGSGEAAASRVNRSDIALALVEDEPAVGMIGDLIGRVEVPVVLMLNELIPGHGDARRAAAVADLARMASTVVVPSGVAQTRLMEQTSGQVQAHIIPHGSSWSALAPRQTPRRHILTWGFMLPGMGVERLIRALANLRDIAPPPQYTVVGIAHPTWPRSEAVKYRRDMLQTAEILGLGGRVRFGAILHSRAELIDAIRHSDVIAVMYDAKDKAASRILTEAVSTGRPVVATRFPGAVEMLSSGAGLTVAHDDAEELEQALRLLLTDDTAYVRAARAARDMSAGLGWDMVASRFFNVLAPLAGAARLGSAK